MSLGEMASLISRVRLPLQTVWLIINVIEFEPKKVYLGLIFSLIFGAVVKNDCILNGGVLCM